MQLISFILSIIRCFNIILILICIWNMDGQQRNFQGATGRMEEGRQNLAMSKVFQNDLLIEIILSKVITSEDKTTLKNCRLVSKNWEKKITKICRIQKKPLFFESFGFENGPQNGQLSNFLGGLNEKVELPTIHLKLGPQYFTQANRYEFVNCLRNYGALILELHLNIPKNPSMAFLMPHLNFSNLQILDVFFSSDATTENTDAKFLVQFLLNEAPTLKQFLLFEQEANTSLPQLDEFFLPNSLNTVVLSTALKSFNLLLQTEFLNLTHLVLSSNNMYKALRTPQEKVVVLLEKLSGTLTSLTLSGTAEAPEDAEEEYFYKLPVLPKLPRLSKLKISRPWRVKTLPAANFLQLEKLVLKGQSDWDFESLVESTKLGTVKSLNIWTYSVLDDNIVFEKRLRTSSDCLLIREINLAFPSITKLTLTFDGYLELGVERIFEELERLVALKFIVLPLPNTKMLLWDNLFTGIPENILVEYGYPGLKSESDLESIAVENQSFSIRNLKMLEVFSLLEAKPQPQEELTFLEPVGNFMTDIAFDFGFLKMPNLKRLVFSQNAPFFPSHTANTKWFEKTGCRIEAAEGPTISVNYYIYQ